MGKQVLFQFKRNHVFLQEWSLAPSFWRHTPRAVHLTCADPGLVNVTGLAGSPPDPVSRTRPPPTAPWHVQPALWVLLLWLRRFKSSKMVILAHFCFTAQFTTHGRRLCNYSGKMNIDYWDKNINLISNTSGSPCRGCIYSAGQSRGLAPLGVCSSQNPRTRREARGKASAPGPWAVCVAHVTERATFKAFQIVIGSYLSFQNYRTSSHWR